MYDQDAKVLLDEVEDERCGRLLLLRKTMLRIFPTKGLAGKTEKSADESVVV